MLNDILNGLCSGSVCLHLVVDREDDGTILHQAVGVLFKLLEHTSGGMEVGRSTWYFLHTMG
jgi:hypothetical protein